jgi:hypothetical protein
MRQWLQPRSSDSHETVSGNPGRFRKRLSASPRTGIGRYCRGLLVGVVRSIIRLFTRRFIKQQRLVVTVLLLNGAAKEPSLQRFILGCKILVECSQSSLLRLKLSGERRCSGFATSLQIQLLGNGRLLRGAHLFEARLKITRLLGTHAVDYSQQWNSPVS